VVVYSHSRISTYENCPFQYKLKYVDRAVPLLGSSIESYMGKVVHEALEWLYDTAINHDLATKKEVIDYYEKRWISRWNKDIRVIKREFDFDYYKDIGRDCIDKYYERYKPFDQSVVIGLEKRVFIDLPEGKKMMGIIDRLDKKSSTHLEVHDYKTSNRVMNQSQADIDRQLSLYAMGIHQNFPEVEKVDLIWHFVKFDKEVKSVRSQIKLEELALETSSKIDMIESAEGIGEFPTSKSILCDWCEYRKQCPEFVKMADKEAIVNNIDNFVKLGNQDIPEEDKQVILKTLGDKIILHSQQTGQKKLKGTKHMAIIKNVFHRIPPDEGDLRWYGLQSLLEKLNLVTDDYDELFSSSKISEEQKNQLKEFFDMEKSSRVVIEEL
jgi:putative RecB family exonuclease